MEKLFRLIKVTIVLFISIMVFYLVPNRQLNVEPISQYPNMPNGCEITSLAMVMNHEGYKVSKEFLCDNFLEKSGYYNANPNKAYIGNPYKSGYYCNAAPIANAANKYFNRYGINREAKDETGMSVIGILNRIIFDKKPVIVWYTVDDREPEIGIGRYIDEYGNKKELLSNSHCIVVDGVGFGKISAVDPIQGKRRINFLEFTKLYVQTRSKAVVIY